jgi:hypothetical protein
MNRRLPIASHPLKQMRT